MKNTIKSGLIASLGLGLLTACTSTLFPTLRHEVANRLSSAAWMIERQIPAEPFSLTVYERMHERNASANIYIEGDGLAWSSKNQASGNPTPANPVALHLATKDNADNVVYIARPCQYSGMLNKEVPCDSAYWTNKRFAPEVLNAYNAALDEIKRRYGINDFNLTGFSGGAAIAAILAAQRDDVLTLRTVAGNLDHSAHSAHHNVSPLDGSLNPPEFSERLAKIPQYHFIGGQDEIVPPAILHGYLQKLSSTNCVSYQLIQEAEHQKGWVDKWPELLKQKPVCHSPAIVAPEINYSPPEPIRIMREAGKTKGK